MAPSLLFVFSHYVKSPIIKSNREETQESARIIWNLLANEIRLEVLVELYIGHTKLLNHTPGLGNAAGV